MSARVRVVVLGAGGELGARVCRLASRVAGVALCGVSRGARGPEGVAMERGDARDAASVARWLAPGDLVVNCVGPFHYEPTALVAACVAARAHYCDLADDVAFAERVRAAARSARAEEARVFVCTGASTVPGIATLLAGSLAGSPRAAEIARVSAYLSVGSGNPASAGLLASLLAPLGRADAAGGRAFAALRALRASDGRVLRFGAFPAPFAGGSVAVGARSVPARFFFGFDRSALTVSLHLAAPLLARVPLAAVPRLARTLVPFARAVSALGTPLGLLAVVAEDANGAELDRIELRARARGLDIPAAPPAWLAARLAQGEPLPSGARELSELVPFADVLRWVRADEAYALSGSAMK